MNSLRDKYERLLKKNADLMSRIERIQEKDNRVKE
jgi:hypothetical protein